MKTHRLTAVAFASSLGLAIAAGIAQGAQAPGGEMLRLMVRTLLFYFTRGRPGLPRMAEA